MAYSTIEDLLNIIPKQELINLTNDEAPAVEINTEQSAKAIEYADELINSYLRNKYELPLKYIPVIVQQISSDIAAYRLYTRRPRKLPDHIVENYNEAKKLLAAYKKEEMVLDLPNEHPDKEITSPAVMVVVNKTNSSRVFSDEMLKKIRL